VPRATLPAPFDCDERFYKFNVRVGPSIHASSKAALLRLTMGMACELAIAHMESMEATVQPVL